MWNGDPRGLVPVENRQWLTGVDMVSHVSEIVQLELVSTGFVTKPDLFDDPSAMEIWTFPSDTIAHDTDPRVTTPFQFMVNGEGPILIVTTAATAQWETTSIPEGPVGLEKLKHVADTWVLRVDTAAHVDIGAVQSEMLSGALDPQEFSRDTVRRFLRMNHFRVDAAVVEEETSLFWDHVKDTNAGSLPYLLDIGNRAQAVSRLGSWFDFLDVLVIRIALFLGAYATGTPTTMESTHFAQVHVAITERHVETLLEGHQRIPFYLPQHIRHWQHRGLYGDHTTGVAGIHLDTGVNIDSLFWV
jgi:hypothetical protein